MNNLTKGTQVKTVWGKWITVMTVRGNSVYCYEENGTYHISKLMLSTAK